MKVSRSTMDISTRLSPQNRFPVGPMVMPHQPMRDEKEPEKVVGEGVQKVAEPRRHRQTVLDGIMFPELLSDPVRATTTTLHQIARQIIHG